MCPRLFFVTNHLVHCEEQALVLYKSEITLYQVPSKWDNFSLRSEWIPFSPQCARVCVRVYIYLSTLKTFYYYFFNLRWYHFHSVLPCAFSISHLAHYCAIAVIHANMFCSFALLASHLPSSTCCQWTPNDIPLFQALDWQFRQPAQAGNQ